MSSSKSPETQQHIPEKDTILNPKVEKQDEENLEKDTIILEEKEVKQDEEKEEEECGFCLFMKEGGCRDTFTDWEKCVEQGENNNEDIVEKCFQVTSALQKCMEAHSEYYAPILQVEKNVEANVIAEFEKNKESEGANK